MSNWSREDVGSLAGQTVVVTGANSGLGYAGTELFAEHGAQVVMACRSLERGETAAAEIAAADDVPRDRLDVRECDLASLASVERFAEETLAAYGSLDVLCNNAGVMAIPRRETEDGFESQLGINHLGHFALTGRLLPALADGDREGRIVTQSSNAHQTGEMSFEDLNWEDSYSKWGAYGRSKLANLLFAYELDRRLTATGIDARSLGCHPGYAGTNLQLRTARESRVPGYGLVMRAANMLVGQSAEMGALPMVYAATEDVPGGSYVGPDGFLNARGAPSVQESSDASHDEADARRLWEWSSDATDVSYPFDRLAAAEPS